MALTSLEVQGAAQAFHSTIPGYEATPLTPLDHLAQRLGVAQVLVKDESKRFGLNAFKALGGSYAMARHLGEQLGLSQEQITFEALRTPAAREKLGERTFVTATDGNHGRGVAWAAPCTSRLVSARGSGEMAPVRFTKYRSFTICLLFPLFAWIIA